MSSLQIEVIESLYYYLSDLSCFVAVDMDQLKRGFETSLVATKRFIAWLDQNIVNVTQELLDPTLFVIIHHSVRELKLGEPSTTDDLRIIIRNIVEQLINIVKNHSKLTNDDITELDILRKFALSVCKETCHEENGLGILIPA
jgi:hypothetical protein